MKKENYGHGFVKPSPIQQKGILPILQNRDTIAQVAPYLIVTINRLNQVPAKLDALRLRPFQSLTMPQLTPKHLL